AIIPMMLLSGLLIDRFDVRIVLVLGCLLTSAAFYMLTVRATYQAALAAMLLAGVGAACVSAACVVLMPRAFFAGAVRKTAAAVNRGMVFFALGSLVTPTLVDVLLRTYDLQRFQKTLNFLAILCLVPALVVAVQWHSRAELQTAQTSQDLGPLFSDLRLW